MRLEMRDVPLPSLIKALDAILAYYEKLVKDEDEDHPYLADVSLRQCVFGRITPTAGEAIYFIDPDPRFGNKAEPQNVLRHAIRSLEHDIVAVEGMFNQRLDSQKMRLYQIAKVLQEAE